MNQDHVGLQLLKHRQQPFEHSRRDVRERLLSLHYGQITIRLDLEEIKNLIKHLAVLTRNNNEAFEALMVSDRTNDGGHLYRFRSRPENTKDSRFRHPAILR